jgi:hypothetical protein
MFLAPDGAAAGGGTPAAAAATGAGDGGGVAVKAGAKSGLTPGDQAAMAAMGTSTEAPKLPDGYVPFNDRPEWLDPRFYDGEKKAARINDLAKSWSEANKLIQTKTEDLKSVVKQEFETERMKARPETPDKYQAKLPADFKLPEGREYKPDENNPMMKWWRKTAHDSGMSQEQFEQGIATYMDAMNYGAPDLKAEYAKLGEKAQDRLKSVENFLRSKLEDRHFQALAPVAVSAEAIEAVEKLMHMTMSPALGGGSTSTPAIKSEAELRKMQMDPRYRDPFKRDPAFVKEVEEGFKLLYPGR